MKYLAIFILITVGCTTEDKGEYHTRFPVPHGNPSATPTPEVTETPTPAPAPTPAPVCQANSMNLWLCHRDVESTRIPFPCEWLCMDEESITGHTSVHPKDMGVTEPTSCMQCHTPEE